jgi:hypothetical protein
MRGEQTEAAAKLAKGELGCYAKAAAKGLPVYSSGTDVPGMPAA